MDNFNEFMLTMMYPDPKEQQAIEESIANGVHKHSCSKCKTVWSHTNDCVLLPQPMLEKAHECPKCHTHHYHKELSDKKVNIEHPANSEIMNALQKQR